MGRDVERLLDRRAEGAVGDLVLSLFPGIGLLDRAFEEEGFCVVRGPDLLWGGDVRRFHPPAGKFDGVIGGPPCQVFSRLRFVNPKAGQKHGNMIPEFERVVSEAMPTWFVMENVPEAPGPDLPGLYVVDSVLVRDVHVGGETNRLRRFSFGTALFPRYSAARKLQVECLALWTPTPEPAVVATGGMRPVPVTMIRDGKGGHKRKKGALANYGYNSKAAIARMCELQGLPADFLAETPFTLEAKGKAIGNGVPLPMGRAIARAVKRALGIAEPFAPEGSAP